MVVVKVAATNKCLARTNKTRTGVWATKKRKNRPRRLAKKTKRDDYITVKRKTLEALIRVGSTCLSPSWFWSWTVDPNVQMARTLQRRTLPQTTAKKWWKAATASLCEPQASGRIDVRRLQQGPMLDFLLVFLFSSTPKGRTEAHAG